MLGLPPTTPNPAIGFATGSLYASIRVDQKQLIYLHPLLQKPRDHWALIILKIMNKNNCGWAKSINDKLVTWNLKQQWEEIRKKTKISWKAEVAKAAEKVNADRIRQECYKRGLSSTELKSKSKSIIQELDKPNYKREPINIMKQSSVIKTRATIMARYGMLCCQANFSFSGKKQKLRCMPNSRQ